MRCISPDSFVRTGQLGFSFRRITIWGNSLKWGAITIAALAGLLIGFAATNFAYRNRTPAARRADMVLSIGSLTTCN